MIPLQHRQEALQKAYVAAVAAAVGVKADFSSFVEYGVDGTFQLVGEFVTPIGERLLRETGYPLDFQLKSTTDCREIKGQATEFSYDCHSSTYNKIVWQNSSDAVPVLLIVHCLPANEQEWLSVSEDALTLRNACYWHVIKGSQTSRARSQVIRIPRSQLFTPEALTDIMREVQTTGGRLR